MSNAAIYKKTPEVKVLDNRGLVVREIRYCRHPETLQDTDEQITRHEFNARGHRQRSIDPRLFELQPEKEDRANFRYLTALTGEVLRTESADAGTVVSLKDIAGRPVWSLNAVNVKRTWQYERGSLGRLLSITEQAEGEAARMMERFVWSDNSQKAKDYNLSDVCARHYDPAGLVQTNSLSLIGSPLSVSRRLLADGEDADWQGEAESDWAAALSDETFTTQRTFDASGGLLSETDAKGNMSRLAYDVAGLLIGSWLTLKGETEQVIIKSLTYSAQGQKLREEHGNGVVTSYQYETSSQRLTGIRTERPSDHPLGAKVLQDLSYAYDPVGNVVKARNNAEATRFWRNQKVEPENTYVYDSLYQLVGAKGREMATNTQESTQLPFCIAPLPDNAYTCYSRSYCYDRGGNLIKIRHSAPTTSNNYTREFTISERGNRAVLSTLSDDVSKVEDLFDKAGHQLWLAGGQQLNWTGRGELKQVTLVDRDSQPDRETYRYDGGSQRVMKRTVRQTSNTVKTQRVVYLPGLELRTTQTGETIKELLHTVIVGEAGRAEVRALHWETGQPEGIGNNQLRYSYDNLIGSSSLELDGEGEVISQEEYYPYGGTAVLSSRSQVEASYKMVRYSGKERDATGLYYYGWRYYQPWAGRWLSADPAETVDGLNVFKMVGNNPISFTDSNGLQKNGKLYIHYHDHDAINLLVAFNSRRIAKGKNPYPVLVESDNERQALLNTMQKIITGERLVTERTLVNGAEVTNEKPHILFKQYKLGEELSSVPEEVKAGFYRDIPQQTAFNSLKSESIYKAIRQMDIQAGGLSRLTVDDKLYLLGHGAAGMPVVASQEAVTDMLSIPDLVTRLKNAGLSKEIRDIRTNWCESADPISLSSFSDLSSLIYKVKKFLSKKVAPAKTLSQELSRAGYNNITVSGYHGNGLTNYGQELYRQRVILRGVNHEGRNVLTEHTRASELRKTYSTSF